MKKLVIIVIGLVFTLTGCSSRIIEPNDKVEYAHVYMNIDETNMKVYAGTADYIFIGTVKSIVNNKVDHDSSYSTYSVTVEENLKGNLVSNIECDKFGGYMEDGTQLLYESDKLKDLNLPEEGEKYIFMAYAQEDGRLVLTEFHGNVKYTGKDIKEEYLEYIHNQVENDRQRFVSKYDVNYKK